MTEMIAINAVIAARAAQNSSARGLFFLKVSPSNRHISLTAGLRAVMQMFIPPKPGQEMPLGHRARAEIRPLGMVAEFGAEPDK